jgi:alpha-L-arabinofuranosidase
VESDEFSYPGYEPNDPPNRDTVPFISAQATLSENRKILYISVINRHVDRDMKVQFSFMNWQPSENGRLWQIKGENYMILNTFEQPDLISIKEDNLVKLDSKFEMIIPKLSVSIIESKIK